MAEPSPLVAALGLEPHVEGGYYRELWRSEVSLPQTLLGDLYSGPRASGSSIYFLLHPGDLIFVPRSRIAEVNLFVRQYLNGILPFNFGFSYDLNRFR